MESVILNIVTALTTPYKKKHDIKLIGVIKIAKPGALRRGSARSTTQEGTPCRQRSGACKVWTCRLVASTLPSPDARGCRHDTTRSMRTLTLFAMPASVAGTCVHFEVHAIAATNLLS